MKKKTFNIIVPEPCQESWEHMTQENCGKFCANCQKMVMDFTTFTDEAFIHYFQTHKTNGCGRFHKHQFSIPIPPLQKAWASNLRLRRFVIALTASLSFNIRLYAQYSQPAPIAITQASDTKDIDTLSHSNRVHGKVYDEKGEGIPGATVMEKGTENGAVSDIDGNFELEVTELTKTVLICKSAGMRTMEIALNEQRNIVFNLEVNNDPIEDFGRFSYGGYGQADPKANLWYHIKQLFRRDPE